MPNFRQGTELQTIHVCDVDPTIAPGIPGGTPNLLLLRTDNNSLYYYAGPLDTDWRLVSSAPPLPSKFAMVKDSTTIIAANTTTLMTLPFDGITFPKIKATESLLIHFRLWFGTTTAPGNPDWNFSLLLNPDAGPVYPADADFNIDTLGLGVTTSIGNTLDVTKVYPGDGASHNILAILDLLIAQFTVFNVYKITAFCDIVPNSQVVVVP